MTALLRRIWQNIWGRPAPPDETTPISLQAQPLSSAVTSFEISLDDPLFDFFQRHSGAVELAKLNFDSPALQALHAAGVQLVVPLVSQGQLIGLLNRGKRLSEQEYSIYDYKLRT
jgi:hypothetical protein